MIVWLASYPRAGHGYVRAIVHRFFGYPSANKYRLRKANIPEAVYGMATDRSLEQLKASHELFFVKTHDLCQDDACPAIYLIRDGRDSLVSYTWQILGKQGKSTVAITAQLFRSTLWNVMTDRRSPFGVWSDNIRAWLRRPHTTVLRFEEVIRAPEQVIGAVEGLGLGLCPRSDVAAPTFAELQQMSPWTFRRGIVGSWQDEFPPDFLDAYWRIHGAMMLQLGYEKHCKIA